MISARHVLATAIAFSLLADPTSARVAAVGFVSHADGAYIGEIPASPGTSIYDGDRLSTEADGSDTGGGGVGCEGKGDGGGENVTRGNHEASSRPDGERGAARDI